MTKYYKKPVEVDAIQWDGRNIEECEKFVGEMLDVAHGSIILEDSIGGRYVLRNDWIVKDVDKNKFYPCDPDNFAKYYAKK